MRVLLYVNVPQPLHLVEDDGEGHHGEQPGEGQEAAVEEEPEVLLQHLGLERLLVIPENNIVQIISFATNRGYLLRLRIRKKTKFNLLKKKISCTLPVVFLPMLILSKPVS